MSDILISLLMLALFGTAWAFLFKIGGLDWLVDARLATARRMLSESRFAFDGEMHVTAKQPSEGQAVAVAASNHSGWMPRPFVHA